MGTTKIMGNQIFWYSYSKKILIRKIWGTIICGFSKIVGIQNLSLYKIPGR